MGPREKLNALIDLFTSDIRSAFMAAVQDITSNVILRDVIAAIEAGDAELAFRRLGFSQAALRPLIASLERSFEQGGVFTGETFPKFLNTSSGRAVFRFDVRNSRAEAWLRDRSSQLITRIEDETRANVQNVLTVGMQDGRNPRNVALDIVGRVDPRSGQRVGGIIGLTKGQETWVRSARRRLTDLDADYFNMELRDKRFDRTVEKAISEGKPLPPETLEKLITRYKDNALKYRGDSIARTEAIHSLNRSEHEAIKQAVDMGAVKESAVKREWDDTGDLRTRWSHRLMRGQRVGLDEPFVSPSGAKMLFPGDTSLGAPASEVVMCRCRAKNVVDWLADLDDDVDPIPVAKPPAPPPKPKVDRDQLDADDQSYLLARGRKTGNESLIGYDAETGEKFKPVAGKKSSVSISEEMMRAINDPARNIILAHNHPSGSSFSPQDIHMLIEKPGLKGLWAHGHNDASFYAERGSMPTGMPVLRQVFDGVSRQMQDLIYSRNLTVDDALKLHSHVASLIYDARGHIKYQPKLNAEMQAAVDRNADLIAKLIGYYSS